MTAPTFTTLTDALAYYRAHDRAPLRAAIAPPVNGLDDQTYDITLAVVFRDIAGMSSRLEQVARIQTAVDVNLPQLEQAKRADLSRQPEATGAAERLGAMVAVLQVWLDEILDAGAQSVVEGRAA